jgi:hypothetical protein
MSVERATGHSRQRDCPACAAPSVILPWFTGRRRTSVTCANCGAMLQRVLPGAAYYTLSLVTGMLAEASVFVLLGLALLQKWLWLGGLVLALVLLNLGVSSLLNARTRIEFDDTDPVSRKEVFGRWYPK